jgi:predicted DCC family thiol-disulfide oxidoreductase YuxK
VTSTATLVYDGDCGICQASVGLLERAGSTATAVPSWQWVEEHPEHADLCLTTVLFVGADGSVAVEEAAVAAALATTRAPLRWLAPLLRAPGLRWVGCHAYRLVARHRTRISAAVGMRACGVDGGAHPPS